MVGTRYWTHLPVLYDLWEGGRKMVAVESGCGAFSSPFLAAAYEALWIIEPDGGWRRIIQQVVYQIPDVNVSFRNEMPDLKALDPDLVFIDGLPETRLPHLQAAIDAGCRLIAYHDAEAKCYGYKRVLAKGYNHAVIPGYGGKDTGVYWK